MMTTTMNRIALLAGIGLIFSSCLKDKNYRTFTIERPEMSIRPEVKLASKMQAAQELKNLGSFVLYDQTMYVVQRDKGIHVIDHSDPRNPSNKGFIPVPGCTGLSIKNDLLYTDCFTDLFVLKIHNRNDIRFLSSVPGVFQGRISPYTADTNVIKINWNRKDTTVSDDYYHSHYELLKSDSRAVAFNNSPMPTNNGGGVSVGSSMAVFTIVKDHLYTVDQSNLNTFSLADPAKPSKTNTQHVVWNVETIFPFKDRLFIGSMTGMFIYSLNDPSNPVQAGQFQHARVCDPVIADDKFAYVTLRNGSRCGGFTNQLDLVNIENISTPVLVRSVPFSNPHGLSKDGKVLLVCDGDFGLKVVDASDPVNMTNVKTITMSKVIDAVALNGIAFIMLDKSIQLYSYDQQFNFEHLSTINKN